MSCLISDKPPSNKVLPLKPHNPAAKLDPDWELSSSSDDSDSDYEDTAKLIKVQNYTHNNIWTF